jgi:hypothetical protein
VEIKDFQWPFPHTTENNRRGAGSVGDGVELPRAGGAIGPMANSYLIVVLMNDAEIQRHVQEQTAHYR